MTPFRVVFLTHNYPRTAGDLAGAFLHPLALALRDRGHEVLVVAPSDRGQGGRDVLEGIPVFRIRYGAPSRERYAYSGRMQEMISSPAGWMALGRLIVAFRREATRLVAGRPSVVHAHWWFPAGLALPPGVPAVVTLHGTDARLLTRPGARWLARRVLRPPRIVTCVSRSVGDLVAPVVGRPIAEEHISPMPVTDVPRTSAGGGGLMVVGRLTGQKRIHLAIEALAGLSDLPVRLTVVGDGPERPRLEEAARARGVADRITWVGRVASDQVGPLLAGADALLLPAKQEGLGLVAIEALLAGVPVIVCNDGGGLLDVAAFGGVVVAAPTSESLAAAARALVGNAAARGEAHRAALGWAVRLAPARVAERVEGWYREASDA